MRTQPVAIVAEIFINPGLTCGNASSYREHMTEPG
jgi:hypothetical protein